jgi:protein dithiol oxidoreductase (disulfide-forming)
LKRRQFSVQLAAASLGLPFLNTAIAQGAPSEGNGYEKLAAPVPVSPPAGKVDVVEFFSYACPHCAQFEPLLGAWTKKPPAGADFRRVPVVFVGRNGKNFQAMYYALEELRLLDAMHAKAFEAIHSNGSLKPNAAPDEIAAWVGKNGGDATKFLAAFTSFSVNAKVMRADQLTKSYDVDGVPLLVVQGRYRTSPAIARGEDAALRATSYLVDMVRKGK